MGCKVQDFGFQVWTFGNVAPLNVPSDQLLGIRVFKESGFRVWGFRLGFRVWK